MAAARTHCPPEPRSGRSTTRALAQPAPRSAPADSRRRRSCALRRKFLGLLPGPPLVRSGDGWAHLSRRDLRTPIKDRQNARPPGACDRQPANAGHNQQQRYRVLPDFSGEITQKVRCWAFADVVCDLVDHLSGCQAQPQLGQCCREPRAGLLGFPFELLSLTSHRHSSGSDFAVSAGGHWMRVFRALRTNRRRRGNSAACLSLY